MLGHTQKKRLLATLKKQKRFLCSKLYFKIRQILLSLRLYRHSYACLRLYSNRSSKSNLCIIIQSLTLGLSFHISVHLAPPLAPWKANAVHAFEHGAQSEFRKPLRKQFWHYNSLRACRVCISATLPSPSTGHRQSLLRSLKPKAIPKSLLQSSNHSEKF